VWHVVCLGLMLTAAPLWAHEEHSPSGVSGEKPTIQWAKWGSSAFKRAKTEDKLIFLDLTAIWCHACHVMDETTYVNAQVVGLLNSSFIPVRVETDQRPDIEARYKKGGWPTTSILLPSGEILYQANALTPDELLIVLEESHSLYRENKEGLQEQAAEVWGKVERAKKSRVRSEARIHQEIADRMVIVMKQNYDQVYGGFRNAPKFFEPETITFAFETNFWRQDSEALDMALFTLDQQRKLYDPVWGGFYRYAEEADWTSPHYEKMLFIQAYNILSYLEAYQITGLPSYREVVEGTIQYVNRFLTDQQQGGFFASQDADVRVGARSQPVIQGKEYFALPESQRLKRGFPHTDRTVYTGWNGLMSKSYLRASHVLGDPELRRFALKTLSRLFDERYQPGKGLAHGGQTGNLQGFGLLEDQVLFVDALIEAYITTGVPIYRDRAEEIAQFVVNRLEDDQGGGFWDRLPTSDAHGLLKFPYKDVKVNATLARIFSDLFYVTQDSDYQEFAKEGLQFILGKSGPFPVGSVGLALNRYLRYPVHIVVVGAKDDPSSKQLFRKALELYVPGKVVRFLDPKVDTLAVGEVAFPRTPVPQAYVCTDTLCSSPIRQAEALGGHLDEVMAGLFEASKPFSAGIETPS